tara:strand:+ start:324 stop:599 length:276 start_codon:yes stop_codon:yes gene_type:complete
MKGELITFNLHTVLYIQAMQSPKQVIIHCKESYLQSLLNLGLDPNYNDGEYDVVVDDIPYTIVDGYYQDPDQQLCSHYGINYDQVNCIEAV